MSYISQDQLEEIVLRALFDFVQQKSGWLTVPGVTGLLEDQFSETRVKMALRVLSDKDFVHAQYVQTGTRYEISEVGYRHAEAAHADRDGNNIGIPAADRVVSLNHNQLSYLEIRSGLAELSEAIRVTNDLPITSEARDRLLAGLEAAGRLWQAAELKIIQIRVGILMAIEDARHALALTAKAVVGALLVDAVKAFIKSHTGVDLDQL